MVITKEELCPRCKYRVNECICCPKCGRISTLSEGELVCPVCGKVKPKDEGE